jgi:hypothetical protein
LVGSSLFLTAIKRNELGTKIKSLEFEGNNEKNNLKNQVKFRVFSMKFKI